MKCDFDMFIALRWSLRILTALRANFASAEKNFSTLYQGKTWFWFRMAENGLVSLCILNAHQDINMYGKINEIIEILKLKSIA